MAKSLSNIQTEDQKTDGMMNKWINCLGSQSMGHHGTSSAGTSASRPVLSSKESKQNITILLMLTYDQVKN
jgi:hypothetical protein